MGRYFMTILTNHLKNSTYFYCGKFLNAQSDKVLFYSPSPPRIISSLIALSYFYAHSFSSGPRTVCLSVYCLVIYLFSCVCMACVHADVHMLQSVGVELRNIQGFFFSPFILGEQVTFPSITQCRTCLLTPDLLGHSSVSASHLATGLRDYECMLPTPAYLRNAGCHACVQGSTHCTFPSALPLGYFEAISTCSI